MKVDVDRTAGTLSFSINGESMGVAFTVPQFSSGDLYFAVSMACQDDEIEIVAYN